MASARQTQLAASFHHGGLLPDDHARRDPRTHHPSEISESRHMLSATDPAKAGSIILITGVEHFRNADPGCDDEDITRVIRSGTLCECSANSMIPLPWLSLLVLVRRRLLGEDLRA